VNVSVFYKKAHKLVLYRVMAIIGNFDLYPANLTFKKPVLK